MADNSKLTILPLGVLVNDDATMFRVILTACIRINTGNSISFKHAAAVTCAVETCFALSKTWQHHGTMSLNNATEIILIDSFHV